MALPVFAPPHPMPVFRVLKTAYRAYLASGNAASVDVPAPPNQAATAATTVAGTIYVDRGVPLPATVSVALWNNGTLKATQSATVNQTTGAYTTTFPANTLVAGTANAVVTSASPVETTTSANFTVT